MKALGTMKKLFIILGAFLWAGMLQASVIYVNASNTSVIQNGDSWATAYASLQAALNEAALSATFSEIWIAQGTYIPTQIYTPGGIPGGACAVALACSATNVALKTFNLPNNVALFGGFKGTETSLKQRNPEEI